jgi:hypothetical protein
LYLANGVTTIRDMGDGPVEQLDWRDELDAGTRTGPTLLQWSPMFETMGWLEEKISNIESPGGKVNAKNPEDMAGLVAGFATDGFDGIKSHVVFSVDVFEAILDASNKHDILLDAHAPIDLTWCEDSTGCWNDFRSLGVGAVAHTEELVAMVDWSDESIGQAAKDAADDGLWVSTTIALMRSLVEQISDYEGQLDATPESVYLNPGVYRNRWDPKQFNPDNYRSDMSEYLSANEDMLVALHEAGASLMAGTDAPLPLMVPGFSLHEELEYMVELGFSPYEALRTTTYNPAKYLGQVNKFGTIEVGKRADIVMLEENPLEDITNTRLISGVMTRGQWFTQDELHEMLELVANANLECWR